MAYSVPNSPMHLRQRVERHPRKNAVRGMIERLAKSNGLNAEQAYMLCSVCADMRISEIVDRPNWVVSCYLPKIVFD